jgi:hypothetical protein
MEDRLLYIKKKLKGRKVYYSTYNPRASYMYDVEDAGDDLLWLIYEVERLREEKGPQA